jgi:hypothetical protein
MVTKLDIAELEVRLTYRVAGMLAVAVTILSVVIGASRAE